MVRSVVALTNDVAIFAGFSERDADQFVRFAREGKLDNFHVLILREADIVDFRTAPAPVQRAREVLSLWMESAAREAAVKSDPNVPKRATPPHRTNAIAEGSGPSGRGVRE